MKKTTVFIFVFLILVSFVYGQDVQEPAQYDANEPNEWNYNDPDFYQQISYLDWDWTKITGNNIETAIGVLENKHAFANPAFYDKEKFPQFLSKLPPKHDHKIHAALAVGAGHGQQLTVNQIKQNINEVPDLGKLNQEHLNTYLEEEYGVARILVFCIENACTLNNGILKNSAGSFPLTKYSAAKPVIFMQGDGTIDVRIDDKKAIKKMWDENQRLTPGKEDNFKLTLIDAGYTKEKDPLGLLVELNLLQAGNFIFKEGKVFVDQTASTSIDGVLFKVDGAPLQITNAKSDLSTSDKIVYLGENEIIAKGSDYRLNFPPKNLYLPNIEFHHKGEGIKGIRNGHIFSIEGLDRDSKFSLSIPEEGSPLVEVKGKVDITNGNKLIEARNNHFISRVTNREKQLQFVEMNLQFEEERENRLVFSSDRIDINSKTLHYSVQYNEPGRTGPAIEQQLGRLVDSRVVRPMLFLLGGRKEGEEEIWQYMRDIYSLNQGSGQIMVIVDAMKSQQRYDANQLKDMLAATRIADPPIKTFFFGHSRASVKPTGEARYVLSAYGGDNAILSPEEINELDIASCVSAYLKHAPPGEISTVTRRQFEEGMALEQMVALATFQMRKGQEGPDYDIADFHHEMAQGKRGPIKFPHCRTVSMVTKALNGQHTPIKETKIGSVVDIKWYGQDSLGGRKWSYYGC